EEGGSRRIACPLDPKHTVSEDKLEKHLKKCNSREKPKPVYYVENINSGSADRDETPQQVSNDHFIRPINNNNSNKVLVTELFVCQGSLSERSQKQLQALLDKLKTAATGLQCDVEDRVLSHPVLQQELDNPKNGDSAHKHLKQQVNIQTHQRLLSEADGGSPSPCCVQSSILGHLEALRLLGRGRCFVEFGAGRGKLSHWIHEALKTEDQLKTRDELQLLLVERCSTRFKAGRPPEPPQTPNDAITFNNSVKLTRDIFICQRFFCLSEREESVRSDRCCSVVVQVDGKHQDDGVQFERLQVDIQHLDLSKVPLLRQKKLPLVGVGKHLCGAATDLALRCLLETPGLGEETEPPQKRLKTSEPSGPESADPAALQEPGPGPVLGLVVALCCHHRCEWRHYVGQQFFLQRGLGPAEFSTFCRMSSWATCGLRPTNQDRLHQNPANQRRDDEEHEPAEDADAVSGFLSAAERERVGRLCKCLIDGGRLDFLKTKGFDSKLIGYVDSQVTLENVLLTAVPSSSS
ncbi:hypothetical protein L3Q82_026144, partial [Scortum barcoo]